MANAAKKTENTDGPSKKPSRLPILIGISLAFLGGSGAFYATWSGMILSGETVERAERAATHEGDAEVMADVTYVDIEPLTISLNPPAKSKHLRFRATLEVTQAEADNVTKLLPRVTDVLNSYLRALAPEDLEDPSALMRLRAQMLRRIQVVTGLGKINDLLIMEFVLN